MRFLKLAILVVLFVVMLTLASQAGRVLVVDAPEKSDAIVVLAGETRVRPARALELLRRGMSSHVFLDAETREIVYDQPLVEIAQRYVDGLGKGNRVSVCPIAGFSTFAEVDDVKRCIEGMGAHRLLVVTSDFHTRRALMIFRKRLPQYQVSVAAARNPAAFGEAWWKNREWAKMVLDEWLKTVWFQAVDRWR
jgi:uncharacterized SAM-binding protein YcdF (DUF218 family)